MTPTQRTLHHLRELGRLCERVERWNQHVGPSGIRQDLFGFIDIVAIDPARGIVGVQSCGDSFGVHYRKLTEDCFDALSAWLRAGGVCELWAWRKVKMKRGSAREQWAPRVREITLADLRGEPLEMEGDPGPTWRLLNDEAHRQLQRGSGFR